MKEPASHAEVDYSRLVKTRERLKNPPPTAPFTILRFPDSRLRTKARPVEEVTDGTRDIADKMLTTMYASGGVGLSATQVNVHRRIIVMDVSERRDNPVFLINPRITEREGETESQEGCLSVPGFYADVKRSKRVRVEALDRDGQPVELEAGGLLAQCVQHEIDHLDGRLFIDHLSPLRRERLLAMLRKKQREQR